MRSWGGASTEEKMGRAVTVSWLAPVLRGAKRLGKQSCQAGESVLLVQRAGG